ncbi:MAG: cytochrome d ubiquinol oxidase subunit II, partial [Bacteroidales bacterium]
MSYIFLQNYWWFLIALLGGLLVALMFVQGANLHLGNRTLSDLQKRMILNSTGRKWELTFTTLVTFGGAFFASFPLFYSTSFGGAYWVWILILITFVFQAVSYEFQNKKENLIGSQAFRVFLMINGILAPMLIGTAVGTFFTGSDFTVNKVAITDPAAPVISTWGSGWHGLEALGQYHAVLLGFALVFLTAILGALYVLNNVEDVKIHGEMRRSVKVNILPFLVFFLCWLMILLVREGYAVDEAGIAQKVYAYTFSTQLSKVYNEDINRAKKYCDKYHLSHHLIDIDFDDYKKFTPIVMK